MKTGFAANGIVNLAGIALVAAVLGREWIAARAGTAHPVKTT